MRRTLFQTRVIRTCVPLTLPRRLSRIRARYFRRYRAGYRAFALLEPAVPKAERCCTCCFACKCGAQVSERLRETGIQHFIVLPRQHLRLTESVLARGGGFCR
jgi:hypothetical protein